MMTYELHNKDFLSHAHLIPDESVDLVIADPPYGLGKDYGNDSDMKSAEELVDWTIEWVDLVIPKLKKTGSLYIFATWRRSPEIFYFMKKKLMMINEIIWDRRVPSMGGSTRRFSSVHDTIGYFALSENYYFDIDAVRIPYDEQTKRQERGLSLSAASGWRRDIIQKMCGVFRACTVSIKSAKIIRRKSPWRLSKEWSRQAVRRMTWC